MDATNQSAITLPCSRPHGEDHCVMPSGFGDLYHEGLEAGYKAGHEAGYEKGFVAGMAAVRQGPLNGAAPTAAVEGKPAPKTGPRRMLIGMPCKRCRVYLLSDDACCPCCRQPRVA